MASTSPRLTSALRRILAAGGTSNNRGAAAAAGDTMPRGLIYTCQKLRNMISEASFPRNILYCLGPIFLKMLSFPQSSMSMLLIRFSSLPPPLDLVLLFLLLDQPDPRRQPSNHDAPVGEGPPGGEVGGRGHGAIRGRGGRGHCGGRASRDERSNQAEAAGRGEG